MGLEDQHALHGAPMFVPHGTWWDGSDCAATLTKQNDNGAQRMPDKDNLGAVLTPTSWPSECAGTLAQSSTGSGAPGYSNQELFSQNFANLVPVPFRKSKRAQSTTDDESWVEAEQANTLNAFDTGERDTHAVAHVPMATIDMQACKGNANIGDGSVSPTLCKPSGNDVHAVAFANRTRDGIKMPEIMADGVTPALTNPGGGGRSDAINVAVAFSCKDHGADAGTVAPSLTASNDPSRSPQSAEVTQQVAAVHAATMTVRRLTPRECERLQAFPDDYTLIPWRKKPADQCPDGPRYKALGNSMAVNCMEWIGERIAAYESKERNP